ncbi:hypothetical protein KQI65_11955 [bacterium]|nr:hypothetical protein [bacterium]
MKLLRSILLPGLLLLIGVRSTPAQSAEEWLYFPAAGAAGELRGAVGLRMLTLPQDVVEEEINKAPSLDVRGTLGLSHGVDLTGEAILQYVTNQFRLGARWSCDLGVVSAAAGYDVALWFGFVDFEGFDNRANGWTHYPYISVGRRTGDIGVTVRGEAIWLQAVRSFAGDNEVRNTGNRLAGLAATAILEQPFWKNTHALLGVRLAWTDFHYQSWFAFSTFKRKLLYSELIFGILL